MGKTTLSAGIVLVLALAFSGVSHSQQGKGGRIFDPKTVETLTGDVDSIDKMAPGYGKSGGIHLKLKTSSENIAVHLGPAWYVEQQQFKINLKDRIEVTGSRVQFGGASVIIAASVKKDGKVMVLRDLKGLPQWSGWRGKNK